MQLQFFRDFIIVLKYLGSSPVCGGLLYVFALFMASRLGNCRFSPPILFFLLFLLQLYFAPDSTCRLALKFPSSLFCIHDPVDNRWSSMLICRKAA